MSSNYYDADGLRVIDAIRGLQADFPAGCILKYVFRAGRKPGASASSDYDKALHYLDFLREPAPYLLVESDLVRYFDAFHIDEDMRDALVTWIKSHGKNPDTLIERIKERI